MFELAVVEQAKGALMLHYGIGSYEALAVLEHWSHESGESLPGLARALTHGVCQGHCHGHEEEPLVRWLEKRLQESLPISSDLGHRAVSGGV